MFVNSNQIIGFILTIITLAITIIGFATSLIMLFCLIYHIYFNRVEARDKINLVLSITIYLSFVVFTLFSIWMNTQAMLGDLYQLNFDSSACKSMGYLFLIAFSALYFSFTNQAFFRLCRIVYSPYRYLQLVQLYVFLPLIELIVICVLMSALFIWHGIVYFPNDHICYIQFTRLRDVLYAGVGCYGIPLLCLSIMYTRITTFMRHQSNNIPARIRQRQTRDLTVVRRICITVTVLATAGLSSIIILILMIITHIEVPLLYRITWFSVSLSITGMSAFTIFSTPQLKNILLKRTQTRIIPFINSVNDTLPKRMLNNTQ